MNRLRVLAVAATLSLLMGATSASAASITFTLNCTFAGTAAAGSCGAPSGPFGTVTLTDSATNANWIDMVVSLSTGNLTHLTLNLSSVTPLSGYTFQVNATDTVTYSPNAVGPGVFDFLDIDIDPTFLASGNPWSATLRLRQGSTANYQDLDAGFFNVLSNDPNLSNPVYAAVQTCTQSGLGQAACVLAGAGTGNYGALTTSAPPIQAAVATPEPSTLLLLGAGLVIAARRLRSRSRR